MRETSISRSNDAPDRGALLAFVLVILLAGSNAVAVRFTVKELAPFWGAAMRFGLAAIIFWVIAIARREPLPRGRLLVLSLVYGAINFGLGYALLYWGLKTVTAGMTQVILALVPLLTFFAAYLHGLESFRLQGLVGAVIAVGGIAWAFFERPDGAIPLLAVLAVVGGAVGFAESIVLLKFMKGARPVMTNALGMTAGTAVLLIGSLLFGEAWQLPVRLPTILSVAYLVVAGSVIVFYLFVYIIERWTASASSYQFVLFPFVTVLVGSWLAGEHVNAGFLLGAALVLVGVWVGAFLKLGRAKEMPLEVPAAAADAD
jgi:drug/metabolite transporter (DMT)-like permease